MLRRGGTEKRSGNVYARGPVSSAAAPKAGASALRMLADASAQQFWEKYFGNEREADWSFFWESLCSEYASVLGEHTDRESELLLKAFVDYNGNDQVSVLELNKVSKDKGMLKGLKDFFKKAEGSMETPVILDPDARKFWKKYMERDRKIDVFFLWESLMQEYEHLIGDIDMVNAEKSFVNVIDKNRNESVTNVEFNAWTRKLGIAAAFKEVLDTSKSTWNDDRDGQWGESETAQDFQRADGVVRHGERQERTASREKAHDDYRDKQRGSRRRGSRDDDRHDSRRSQRNSVHDDDDDDDGYEGRRGRRAGRERSYDDDDEAAADEEVDFGSGNFEAQLEARMKREEEEMKQAEVRREKQRNLDRDRKGKERDESRREREGEMLHARRELIQKQEEEDAKRREESDAAARAARWAEADIKIKANSDARMARLEELEKKMKIENDKRFGCLTLKGHEGHVTGISLCADKLVSCSEDKTIKVWDVDKQKVKKTLSGHKTRITAVASDNKSIISGSRDGEIHIWDVRTGEITDTEPADHSSITCLSMGTVPRHAMIGRADGEIRLMDMRTPITIVRTFFGHTGAITGLDFNGDILVSSSSDSTARVWDFGTGTCIHQLKGHYSDVSSIKLDENKIVTGSYDETIRYWDIASGKCRQKMLFPMGMVSSVQTDGSELIAGSLCNKVNVYDSTTGELRYSLQGRDGHEKAVNKVLANKGQIYSCSNDMTVKVWTLLD